MNIPARFGTVVVVDDDGLCICRGAGSGFIVQARVVERPWDQVMDVKVAHLGRLPFVAVTVQGLSSPDRPFDDWSIPSDDDDAAHRLATHLRHAMTTHQRRPPTHAWPLRAT